MKKFLISLAVVFLFMPVFVPVVSAEECNEKDGSCVKLNNPLGVTEVPDVVSLVIKGAMGLMGAIVLFMFVWGGMTWLLSAGNPEKISAGAKTMVWAAIGAAVVLLSYIVLTKILEILRGQNV